MYNRKRRIYDRAIVVPEIDIAPYDATEPFHKFSYFVNGGSDPTGQNTDMTNVTVGDTPEDIAAGLPVDAFADPRTNMFDVIEQIGVENASKAIESAQSGEVKKE